MELCSNYRGFTFTFDKSFIRFYHCESKCWSLNMNMNVLEEMMLSKFQVWNDTYARLFCFHFFKLLLIQIFGHPSRRFYFVKPTIIVINILSEFDLHKTYLTLKEEKLNYSHTYFKNNFTKQLINTNITNQFIV